MEVYKVNLKVIVQSFEFRVQRMKNHMELFPLTKYTLIYYCVIFMIINKIFNIKLIWFYNK